MIILFQNILFLKEFLVCKGCFGLFTKIKNGFGISFWRTFYAWFFHKNVPYLIPYQLTKFQRHICFPSQDIRQNVLLSSYSWGFILDHPWKQWLTRKRGKEEIQKFEYLENKNSFLDEINIFRNSLGYDLVKKIKNNKHKF